MENKKFEQLIDLIINENEEKARELFHEIVVEKSREIYENIMDEEMHDDSVEEGDQVGGMLDEIEVEETMSEDDDAEVDFDDEAEEAGDELTHDMEDDHDEGDKVEDLEDRVVDVENELEELMAKFEEMMGGSDDAADMGGEESGEEMMEAADDEEDVTEAEEVEEEAVEEAIAEAVQLKKVPVPSGGDDGANKKSIALTSPKVKTAGVNPVMSKGTEAVPTGPKAPSNVYTKGEKEVPGAGNFKNVPGKDNFKEKGESTPKPVTSQASGVNTKSPVSKG